MRYSFAFAWPNYFDGHLLEGKKQKRIWVNNVTTKREVYSLINFARNKWLSHSFQKLF